MSRHRPYIFFLTLTYLYTGSRNLTPSFGTFPQIRPHKLLSLSSSWLLFSWRLRLLDSPKNTSCPITSACRVGSSNIRLLCTCTNNTQTSSPPSLITRSATTLLFGDYCLHCLLIYLSIHWISYEPFRYVTLKNETQEILSYFRYKQIP